MPENIAVFNYGNLQNTDQIPSAANHTSRTLKAVLLGSKPLTTTEY